MPSQLEIKVEPGQRAGTGAKSSESKSAGLRQRGQEGFVEREASEVGIEG